MARARALVAFSAALTVPLGIAAVSADGAGKVGSWRTTGTPLSSSLGPTATLTDGRVLVLYTVTEREFAAGPLPGERIVVAEHRHLASEFYEPRSRTWTAGPPPPGESASTLVALPRGGALLLGETVCERRAYAAGPLRGLFETVCHPTQAAYRLNSSGSAWARAGEMLVPRINPAVAPLKDGRILVAGGSGAPCTAGRIGRPSSCAPLSSAEVFDPASATWTATVPMPATAGEASATTLSDGTVLMLRGEPREPLRFDPLRGIWTSLPPPPEPLGPDLHPLPGDRAISLGGTTRRAYIGSIKAPTRAFECVLPQIYSARSGKWTSGPPPPGPPSAPVRACEGGAVELAGGQILLPHAILIDDQRCWVTTGSRVGSEEGFLVPLLDGGALSINSSYSSPTAETYAPAAAKCGPAQLTRANLFEHISPRGGVVTPRRLLSRGYSLIVHTAGPGDVHVNWYAIMQTGEGVNRVLLADGGARSSGTRPVKITVRLTPEGELQLAEEMSVEAQGIFAARGRSPVMVLRTFKIEERPGHPLAP